MNHPTNAPDEATAQAALDDLALRHVLGELTTAEETEFAAALSPPDSRASQFVTEHQETLASLVLAAKPVTPPSETKARIMGRIAKAADSRSASTEVWMSTPFKGVRMREISPGPGHAILMLECAPGAAFPEHDHAGTEDVYIISGEATMGDQLLRAGDFLHAEEGHHHDALISVSGCRALIITSRKNYSPIAARAYSFTHKLVARIGSALGLTQKS